MRAALRERDVCDGQREEDLDRKLQPCRDAQRTHSQLALIVREADETASNEPADGGPHARMACERGEQAADDAQDAEENAAAGRRAGRSLVALAPPRLHDLSPIHPLPPPPPHPTHADPA